MTEPHTEGQHWVAQEGPYSAGVCHTPVIRWCIVQFLRSAGLPAASEGCRLYQSIDGHSCSSCGATQEPAQCTAAASSAISPLPSAAAAAATSDVAVLHYFPARGRAEPIRWVELDAICLKHRARRPGARQLHTRAHTLPLSPSARACACRLAMALVGQPWFEPPIEPLAAVMRRQLDSYPFRQLPRYVEEGDVDLVQSMVGVPCAWACGGWLGRQPTTLLLAAPCSSSRTPLRGCR
jgi:hypothetical protein